MADFKFLCPACGQKISCNEGYSGRQIACPACKNTISVPPAPQIVSASAPTSTAAPAKLPPIPQPKPASVAPPGSAPPIQHGLRPLPNVPGLSGESSSAEKSRISALAVASLLCSVWVFAGCIPGIICGHMAKARMRRNVFLEGERMATAGLIISYCILSLALTGAGAITLAERGSRPIIVLRETQAAQAALKPRIVDEVTMGDSGNEDDHDREGGRVATTKGKPSRAANKGGGFSYTMKVLPDRPMNLNCRYWGSQAGRAFDVAVDEHIIGTQSLEGQLQGHFFDVEYRIPMGLTRGKEKVKVQFVAHMDAGAGGVFGCQTVTR